MDAEEFVKLLKSENAFTEDLIFHFKSYEERGELILRRKEKSLVEDLKEMLASGLYPIVDKKLRVILGLQNSFHNLFRTELFRYHNAVGKGFEVPYVDPREAMDRYIYEGMGYYFSSTKGRQVIVGDEYIPDSYDVAVFEQFKKASRI